MSKQGRDPGFFQRGEGVASKKQQRQQQQYAIIFVMKSDRQMESDKFGNFPKEGRVSNPAQPSPWIRPLVKDRLYQQALTTYAKSV